MPIKYEAQTNLITDLKMQIFEESHLINWLQISQKDKE